MMRDVRPARLLLKSAALFILANALFAWINPPVGKLTLYNWILPGRLRFPYEQEPKFYFVGYNAPVYEDFDAMFGAHIISRRKRDDEFRVVFLGDSSMWSISVQADEMLSEQINKQNLKTCDDRMIRAYNLGYPMPFLMRDLLILDKAMEYQPDMVVWLISLLTLESKNAETYFILPHADRYLRLLDTYDLDPVPLLEPIPKAAFFDRTIIGQRRRLRDIMFTQAMGIPWAATGIDNHEGLRKVSVGAPDPNVEPDANYEKMSPGDDPSEYFDSLRTDIISAAYEMAGDVPVILINQPIFIASGTNSDVRYNETYPRWIYDDYRAFLSDWANQRGRPQLDFWNALPPADFADRNFHRNAQGEKDFANVLAPALQQLICP